MISFSLISLMLKNLEKMRHFSSNLWTDIYGKKWIVYKAKKFSIQSLFVSIKFKIDQNSLWQTEYCSYLLFPISRYNLSTVAR